MLVFKLYNSANLDFSFTPEQQAIYLEGCNETGTIELLQINALNAAYCICFLIQR